VKDRGSPDGRGRNEGGFLSTRAFREGTDRARAVAIELGDEPPIFLDGDSAEHSHQVNMRWLAGTVLTAFAALLLLGTTVYTSMDGHARFAKAPRISRAVDNLREVLFGMSNTSRKSDQITAAKPLDEGRQTLRLSVVSHVGDAEVVRSRQVVRVSGSLLATGDTKDLPKFNPLTLMNAGAAPPPEAPSEDADVSYVVRDLANITIAPDQAPVVPMEEVLTEIRDAAAMDTFHTPDLGPAALALDGVAAPDAPALGAPVAAPNVTVLAKSNAPAAETSPDNEKVVTVDGSDSLATILTRNGATPDEARAVADAFAAPGGYGTIALTKGQQVRILQSPTPTGRLQPVRVTLSIDGQDQSVALSDNGDYVAVAGDVQIAEGAATEDAPDLPVDNPDDDAPGSRLRLFQSLYATADARDIPRGVVDQLVHVFSYDDDMQRRVAAGDGFEVLYAPVADTKPDSVPEVLYASLVADGETHRYYRFTTPDGDTDWYDETGRSARKFLLRKPVPNAVLRSGFGLRRHPILGTAKMHTGIDWAAPRGTPIFAAGSGTIEYAKVTRGYGQQVKIRHANGYETAYAHMSAFARGIKAGVRVRQGQLIGYVGSTGLSTGPHCHFEILVNGRFVDPMRIRVPRGDELSGQALADFEDERQRVDEAMGRTDSAAVSTTKASSGG